MNFLSDVMKTLSNFLCFVNQQSTEPADNVTNPRLDSDVNVQVQNEDQH